MKKYYLLLLLLFFSFSFSQNKEFIKKYELVRMGGANSQVGELVNMNIQLIFYYQNQKVIIIKSETTTIKCIMYGTPEQKVMQNGERYTSYMARDNISGSVYEFSLFKDDSSGVKCMVMSEDLKIVCY